MLHFSEERKDALAFAYLSDDGRFALKIVDGAFKLLVDLASRDVIVITDAYESSFTQKHQSDLCLLRRDFKKFCKIANKAAVQKYKQRLAKEKQQK